MNQNIERNNKRANWHYKKKFTVVGEYFLHFYFICLLMNKNPLIFLVNVVKCSTLARKHSHFGLGSNELLVSPFDCKDYFI